MADAQRMRTITWQSTAVVKSRRIAAARAREQVAAMIQTAIRRKISKPYPPASRPYRPPHLRTGDLRDTLVVSAKGRAIQVRLKQYGVWLDGGTSRMKPRPFVGVTLHDRAKYWNEKIQLRARKFTQEAARKRRRAK